MPIVKRSFYDKEDNYKAYSVGDSYQNENSDRVVFLMDKGFLEQKRKQPPEPDFPNHVGGGYYELPNGDRVQGKKAALEAMDGD